MEQPRSPVLPEHSTSFPMVQEVIPQDVPFLHVMFLPMRVPTQSSPQPSADRSPPIRMLGDSGIGNSEILEKSRLQFWPFRLPVIGVNPGGGGMTARSAPCCTVTLPVMAASRRTHDAPAGTTTSPLSQAITRLWRSHCGRRLSKPEATIARTHRAIVCCQEKRDEFGAALFQALHFLQTRPDLQ